LAVHLKGHPANAIHVAYWVRPVSESEFSIYHYQQITHECSIKVQWWVAEEKDEAIRWLVGYCLCFLQSLAILVA